MSTSTGAPSALARALGFHDARKGTAANAAPTTPVATVATVRNWRLPVSSCSLIQPLLAKLCIIRGDASFPPAPASAQPVLWDRRTTPTTKNGGIPDFHNAPPASGPLRSAGKRECPGFQR